MCDLLFAPDEAARAGRSTRPTRPSFWDLVNRQDWAICESVQRGMSSRGYTQGWFAPMEDASLDIRRWLLPRLGSGRLTLTQRASTSSSGWRRARQRDRLAAGPPRRARRGARAVRARARARRVARHSRILRHSYHTPATSRLTFEAYDDWADAGGATPARRSSPSPAGSTCSRRARRSRRDDYTSVMDARAACRTSVLDRRRGRRRAGRSSAARRHGGAAPGATGDRARRARAPRAMQRLARAARRGAARATSPVTGAARPGATASRSTPGGADATRGRRVVVTADAWTNDVLGHLGARCR